jgi:hypothetical protein
MAIPANSTIPMYLSIQLASSGASTFLMGALTILFFDNISTASARLASQGISITVKRSSKFYLEPEIMIRLCFFLEWNQVLLK